MSEGFEKNKCGTQFTPHNDDSNGAVLGATNTSGDEAFYPPSADVDPSVALNNNNIISYSSFNYATTPNRHVDNSSCSTSPDISSSPLPLIRDHNTAAAATNNHHHRPVQLPTPKTERLLTKLGSSATFPLKLYCLLQDAHETEVYNRIVGWTLNGKAFKVFDTKGFEKHFLPVYFGHSKYKSFQRQLYMYNFERVTHGSTYIRGSYTHQQFIRGEYRRCQSIGRKSTKNNDDNNNKTNKMASSSTGSAFSSAATAAAAAPLPSSSLLSSSSASALQENIDWPLHSTLGATVNSSMGNDLSTIFGGSVENNEMLHSPSFFSKDSSLPQDEERENNSNDFLLPSQQPVRRQEQVVDSFILEEEQKVVPTTHIPPAPAPHQKEDYYCNEKPSSIPEWNDDVPLIDHKKEEEIAFGNCNRSPPPWVTSCDNPIPGVAAGAPIVSMKNNDNKDCNKNEDDSANLNEKIVNQQQEEQNLPPGFANLISANQASLTCAQTPQVLIQEILDVFHFDNNEDDKEGDDKK